jgi:hypothetical protein
MAHFIKTKDTVTASGTADDFMEHVWKLHGLPLETVSDRGTTFNSQFLRALYKRLGIKPSFSTAYHPQTDGKAERVNQSIEQYLRLFCNHAMDNWTDLLPLAEFVFNNSVNASTGMTPFYANYGYHPTLSTLPDGSNNPAADERIAELEKIHEELKAAMQVSQEVMKRNYDRNVRQQPLLEPGDKVWLEATNISTNRPSKKLDHKRLGPFPVKTKVSDTAYELTLPASMRIHPVFHVNLLTPVNRDQIEGRRQARVPIPVVRSEEVLEIDKVRGSRWQGNTLLYNVKWKGRPAEEDSEVSYEDLWEVETNRPKILKFHEDHPEAWSLTKRPATRADRRTRRGI